VRQWAPEEHDQSVRAPKVSPPSSLARSLSRRLLPRPTGRGSNSCAVGTNSFMLQPVWCSIQWLTAIAAGEHDAYTQPVFPSWLADAAAPRRSPCSTPFAIHDRPPRRCSLFHRRAADVPAAGVSRGPKGKPTPAGPGLYRCPHPFLLVRHRSVRGWAGAANPPIAEESSRQNPVTGGRSQVTVLDSSHSISSNSSASSPAPL
jgi:hypothetical protein